MVAYGSFSNSVVVRLL
jgi:hypothetical protein